MANTSKGVLFLPPSDAYVRSFLYLLYTLIKTLLHKSSERSSLVSGPGLNSSPLEVKNPSVFVWFSNSLSDWWKESGWEAAQLSLHSRSFSVGWRIPGMREPGGLPSMGSHRLGDDWSDLAAAAVCCLTWGRACPLASSIAPSLCFLMKLGLQGGGEPLWQPGGAKSSPGHHLCCHSSQKLSFCLLFFPRGRI